MKKFVVLYYSPADAMAKMATTPKEDMQAEQAKWMAWFKKAGDGLVDMGEFFTKGKKFTKSGTEDCSGNVTGYSILQAESLESAEQLLENHPHLDWYDGCSIELYEPMDMSQH